MATKPKARKQREKVDPNETKRARFIRLGNARIHKARRAILQVERLANKSGYEFTEADAAALTGALDKAVTGVHMAFDKALAPKPSAENDTPLIG